MIQVNFTLFIQLINFLVLLFLLNALLYQPVMAKMREREAQIKKRPGKGHRTRPAGSGSGEPSSGRASQG